MTQVALTATTDRRQGVEKSLDALNINPVKGKQVLIKPNFNTADSTPGSTHNDTLMALVDRLWEMGAAGIRLGERSYPPTAEVMEKKGVLPLLKQKQVEVIDFDDLPADDWVPFHPDGSHWPDGFRIARPILEAECLVCTGCLKTHQFGGVITLSLKLHVGVVATTRNGFPFMEQLHSSPHQQEMIAEINQPFSPDLVVMDGIEAFVDGGPAYGKRAAGNVFWASTDRVAIDAVGAALLKHLGSNTAIMDTPVFSLRQIARAVELGIGVQSPADIELVAADAGSGPLRDAVAGILSRG
jgi:uncharacterized protein (DUF362 family)